MTYVMSDLHGQYGKYLKMLDKIGLTEDDDLFILGDIIDRGPDGVKILQDMSLRANVFPVLGNHELMALRILKKLCVEITEENYSTQIDKETMMGLSLWQMDGGDTTLRGFRTLDNDEKLFLIDFMKEFSPYDMVSVGGKDFVLVHGGIPYDKRHMPLYEQDISELVTERPDYDKVYFENKYLVTGHTPTCTISPEYDGKIMVKNNHIAIDCGAGFDKPLGCIRLDDMVEFYV